VLQDHFSLKVSHKANSESGIPLDILGLHPTNFSALGWITLAIQAPLQLLLHWPQYKIYLVEMGIDSPDEPKNMSYLLKIIQPSVGIFLNAGPVHAATFDHLISESDPEKRRQALIQLIAQEKGKLLQAVPKSGYAIANADDEAVFSQLKKSRAHHISFGKSKDADVQILATLWKKFSTEFQYKYKDNSVKIEVNEHILPEMYSYSFAAALACGISQGLSLEQAASSLKKHLNIPPGRSSLIPAINGATIIDSSYNASTGPMLDMLKLLKKVPGKRKLALLGDMREIGAVAAHEHLLVALEAAKTCNKVFLVGPLTQEHILPVLESKKIPAEWFKNAFEAAKAIQHQLKKDDVLLVKGSQNTLLLEIAVEKLMAEPAKANELLCRRGEYWNQRRKAIELA
jgi:UDP-N-acetylmuramyl pentapeptide synthase